MRSLDRLRRVMSALETRGGGGESQAVGSLSLFLVWHAADAIDCAGAGGGRGVTIVSPSSFSQNECSSLHTSGEMVL